MNVFDAKIAKMDYDELCDLRDEIDNARSVTSFVVFRDALNDLMYRIEERIEATYED